MFPARGFTLCPALLGFTLHEFRHEWLEGERFGLRPLKIYIDNGDFKLRQIVFNLTGLTDQQTQVTIQCEYESSNRLAKIKNLVFLRRRYLRRMEESLAALERVAGAQREKG